MRHFFCKSVLAFGLILSTQQSFAQAEEGVYCFHIETKNGTSKFLNYLFARYGVEHSEQVLLNTKLYEAQNNVFVLYSADYKIITEKIEAALLTTTDPDRKASLLARKAKLVRFESIEDQVNH